jgi:hypothetical protein
LGAELFDGLLQVLDQVAQGQGGIVAGAEVAEEAGIWPG